MNIWSPREGTIEVGVKGSATLNSYFPSQGGYVASMAYRNALDQEVVHSIGVFRLHGRVVLSCFAGARAQGEAGVKTRYRPAETSAGATALLGTPSVAINPRGSLGVKADAFAGAQVGGTLSGIFEWVAPDKQGTGKAVLGQTNADSNWAELARISVEGNVAAGAGLAGEFGIAMTKDRLTINCKGSVVFGPGAGGSFGTVVDIEQVGKLVWLFCDALAAVDYRYLVGVTEKAFSYISSGLFQVATAPLNAASKAFNDNELKMSIWWENRKATKAEARDLASYIDKNKTIEIRDQHLPFSTLPPETLGPMVYLLTEGFVESFNEKQEEALVTLLSEIKTWRHFIKTLEHCSPHGEKVNAMDSLERINSLLDSFEQKQFNKFIDNLAVHQTAENSTLLAWKTSRPWYKEEVLIAARNSGEFDGLA